jgi:hypothetical protein
MRVSPALLVIPFNRVNDMRAVRLLHAAATVFPGKFTLISMLELVNEIVPLDNLLASALPPVCRNAVARNLALQRVRHAPAAKH